jgi:hypothetical protein
VTGIGRTDPVSEEKVFTGPQLKTFNALSRTDAQDVGEVRQLTSRSGHGLTARRKRILRNQQYVRLPNTARIRSDEVLPVGLTRIS